MSKAQTDDDQLKKSPTAKRTSKINTWKPKSTQQIVEQDGKLFVCHFDKVLEDSKLAKYNRFFIKKASYENQLDIITRYTNFFLAFYDTDNELISAYLKIKFMIDKYRRYNEENMDAYISFIYQIMFRPTIVDKIERMVEDNYLDDIDSSTDDKKKYMKNEKKHLESLEFTNNHIKILLCISFSMKIMAAPLFHYLSMNNIKIEKDSEIIYNFYKRLFVIFGHGKEYELYDKNGTLIQEDIDPEVVENLLVTNDVVVDYTEDGRRRWYNRNGEYYQQVEINLYNKLYVYVKAKVLESNSNNSPIFEQREIFGVDLFTVINQFTKKVLISENIVKYKFNEHWDDKQKKFKENIVGFNKTIIKFQLSYFLKEQYQKNLSEVTNTKNADGLSQIDKMAMNISKIDEGSITLADINIDTTVKRLFKMIDVPIYKEEVQYYIDNLKRTPEQNENVYNYYAKYFGSVEQINLLSRTDFVILLLLLKKKLLLDLGNDIVQNGKEVYVAALPYMLSGNLESKVNTRIIRNSKFIAKIKESSIYQYLVNEKYKMIEQIQPGYVLRKISTLINTRYTYVTYECPEMTGQEILYSEDKIGDEALYFLRGI